MRILINFILVFSMVGCISKPPLQPLDTKKAIHTVQFYDNNFIYSQNETLLDKKFKKDLIAYNPDWKKEVKRSQHYTLGSLASFIISAVALGFYIGSDSSDSDDEDLALAAGALGFSLLSFSLGKKGSIKMHKVVKEYNKNF